MKSLLIILTTFATSNVLALDCEVDELNGNGSWYYGSDGPIPTTNLDNQIYGGGCTDVFMVSTDQIISDGLDYSYVSQDIDNRSASYNNEFTIDFQSLMKTLDIGNRLTVFEFYVSSKESKTQVDAHRALQVRIKRKPLLSGTWVWKVHPIWYGSSNVEGGKSVKDVSQFFWLPNNAIDGNLTFTLSWNKSHKNGAFGSLFVRSGLIDENDKPVPMMLMNDPEGDFDDTDFDSSTHFVSPFHYKGGLADHYNLGIIETDRHLELGNAIRFFSPWRE